MTATDQTTSLLRLSLRTCFAILAAFGAFVASPISLDHLCLLDSLVIDVFLIFVVPLGFGVAAAATRKLWVGLFVFLAAPVISLGLANFYHDWLHTDSFPQVLLSKRARQFQREAEDAIKFSREALRAEQVGASNGLKPVRWP